MRLGSAAAVAAACLVFVMLVSVPGARAAQVDVARAELAYQAMQQWFFDPQTGGYREQVGVPDVASAWPTSQALAAAIALARLPQTHDAGFRLAQRQLRRLDRFYRHGAVYAAAPGSGAVYWDDNEWIAQDLLDWNSVSADPRARDRAAAVFAAIVGAWNGDTTRPCPGGVEWTTVSGNTDRNTVSTGNGALVGIRLYALTHRSVFLWWSQRMLGWLDTCLRAPSGLYWDHIGGDGSVDQSMWSYNQGSLVGAYLQVYRATGDLDALARAEAIANATLTRFAHAWMAEPPEFAAIFFRNLLDLASVDGNADYVAAAESYGEAAWNGERDPATGLFRVGWGPTALLEQAAFVQLYATLGRTSPRSSTSGQ